METKQFRTYMVTATIEVKIVVENELAKPGVVERCVENVNDWRGRFYSELDNEEAVLEHLAFNCIVNGTRDISELDGWADLPKGAAVMSFEVVD